MDSIKPKDNSKKIHELIASDLILRRMYDAMNEIYSLNTPKMYITPRGIECIWDEEVDSVLKKIQKHIDFRIQQIMIINNK